MRFACCAVAALAFSGPALAKSGLEVMTQNQYLGADLAPIIAAAAGQDPLAFNQAVITALSEVAKNDFAKRAKSLAKLIARRRPHVVGLQEVYRFTCTDAGVPVPGMGCDDPSIAGAFNDQLALTKDALDDISRKYGYVVPEDRAIVWNFHIQDIPVWLYGSPGSGWPDIFVEVLDRDVILVREDLAGESEVVPFSDYPMLCPNPSVDPGTGSGTGPGCNYQADISFSSSLGVIEIKRGYVGVDIRVDHEIYRVVNTHLEQRRPNGENDTLVIQALQAAELIQVLNLFPNPDGARLLVVGDINSSPEDPVVPNVGPPIPPFDVLPIIPPYRQFVSSTDIPLGGGYTDAWTLRPGAHGKGRDRGLTCCQRSDLSNRRSEFYERIDMIFSADVPDKVRRARVVGDKGSDKTRPPGPRLWPSDHGSVAAKLHFR